MAWNVMQIEMLTDDLLIRPMVGDGGMTRDQAHATVQGLLDRVPQLAEVAAAWRRGAKDDTAYAGPFIWTIYEYDDGEDPRRAAHAWCEDLVATMRTAGMDVQIARWPG